MSVPLTDLWGSATDAVPLIVPGVPLDFNTDCSAFTDIAISPNYATVANGASASSDTQATGAGDAIDSDDSTAWIGGSLDIGERITIDLGSIRTIDLIRVLQGATPADDQSAQVLIEYSDDNATWSNIGSFAGLPELVDTGGPISARYWRFTDQSGSFWHPVSGWHVYSIEIGTQAPVDSTDPTISSPYIDPPSNYGWKTGWFKLDYSGIGSATPTLSFDVSATDVVLIVWERTGGAFVEVDRVRHNVLDTTLYAGLFYVEVSFRGFWQGPPFSLIGTVTAPLDLIFDDDFSRTVATGLGAAPDTTIWSNVINDLASVTPGYARLGAVDDSVVYHGLPWIKDGEIWFDFWVPAHRSDSISYRVDGQDVLVSGPSNRFLISVQVSSDQDGSNYLIATGGGAVIDMAVSANTWYRVRYSLDVANTTGYERLKVWKAALAEPSTWGATHHPSTFSRPPLSDDSIGLHIGGGTVDEARLTNLKIYTAHLDTVIWDPSSPHFGGGPEPPPPPHDIPCVVKIEVNGEDVTDLVVIETAQFESAASGQVGTCEFALKDLEHTEAFPTGKPITLKLDDVVQWRGFVANVARRYAFSVDRVSGSHPELTPRFLVVRGNDINILFSKRFVYNKADPTKHTPIYAQNTTDQAAILDLGSNYLDLSGDGISTSGVTHVGNIAPDGKSYVFQPGMTWGDAMAAIAQLPGALFYIDPMKVLRYVDVDTVTAPFQVSDKPVAGGPTAPAPGPYGIREVTITKDGTALAVDALVWGAGLGDTDMHFQRYANSSFKTIHGGIAWQWGDFRTDLYKDKSLLARAKSYVDGSSQSGRGHRDDAVGVEFVLFKAGLIVGQVVTVQVLTYQFLQNLPIRRIRISFVGAQRQADDTFKFFVRFWVNASNVIDDPWSDAEYPVPLNYRKEPNCQFVPRVEACTEEGWTPVFYDPFDRSWSVAGPWGNPGCAAWGHETHTTFTGTEWVHVGPGPWCIVYASSGSGSPGADVTIQDGSTLAPGTIPQAMAASFAVTAHANGTVSATNWSNDLRGEGKNVDLGWGVSAAYYLRIRKTVAGLAVWMWRQTDPEPDFPAISLPTLYVDGTAADFQGRSLMGEDLQITARNKPGQFGASTQAGSGWVYYTDAFPVNPVPVYNTDWVSIYPPYVWQSRFWPAGTFPVNPDIVGSTQPINAICTSLGVPGFYPEDGSGSRADGGDHAADSFRGRRLYDLHWAWNSDNGLDGTTQADGRMIVRDHEYAGFLAPQGATHVYVTARVYINAPETGIFSLGSQPGPSGEGGIDWELWDVDSPWYDGTTTDDTVDAAHTVIDSGTLSDYTYKDGDGGPITIYADVTFDRDIAGGEVFQLGGKITNTDSNLINTHGPAESFAVNSGGRRVLELKVTNATVRFDWEPTACGDVPAVLGYQQQAVNCKTGNPFCEVPKFKLGSAHSYETLHDYVNNSLIVYLDGKRQKINVDYVETDPLNGQFDFLAEDGDLSDRLSACYFMHDFQIFPLPKADPHYNKHPGYPVSAPPVEDYHPKFLSQFGWHTVFDSVNCTCTSAAVWLDAVTYGGTQVTPPDIRAAQSDQSGGISLSDAADALATYGQTLHVHTGSFGSFSTALDAGPVVMAGLYSQIPRQYNSDLQFLGGHSMLALCFSDSKKAILVYDPLNTAPIWMPTGVVRAYMEAFGGGSCEYGATI